MKEVGAVEAKSRLGQLLDWVEAGEEVVITRRGKIVARLVPPSAAFDRERDRRAAQKIREMRKGITLSGLSLTVTWCFDDETTPATETILDRVSETGAIVPTLWRLEVANAFQSAIRRQRITVKKPRSNAKIAFSGPVPLLCRATTSPSFLAAMRIGLGTEQRQTDGIEE